MNFSKTTIAFICSALVLVVFVLLRLDAPIGDFGNYYFGSLFYLDAIPFEVLYDPYRFNALIREYGTEGLYLNFGVFPPITALLFTPAAFFDIGLAKAIWNILSSILLLLSLFRLAKHLDLKSAYIPLILLVFSIPMLSNFYQGQFYMVLLVLLIEGWMAYETKRFWLSATLWGVAAMTKIFPLVLIVVLLGYRDFKQIMRVGASIAAIFLAGLILIPFEVWWDYAMMILPKIMEGKFSDPYSSTFQSMSILLQKAFVFDGALNANPLIEAPWIFNWLNGFFKFFILYIVWVFISKTKDRFGHFAIVLMYAAVFNGYSTVYSLIMLIPLAIFCFQFESRSALISIGFLVVALSLPVSNFTDLPLLFQFPRLWLLLALFVFVLFRHSMSIDWRVVVAVFLAPLLFAWFKPQHSPESEIVQLQRPSLLTTDYSVVDSGLVVTTFDVQGLHEELYPLDIEEVDSTNFSVTDRQIAYMDVNIFSSIDRKKKPLLINRTDLYFLSDEGRGVGFYALRKMPMTFEE